MKREVKITADGSKTLFVESLDEHYHSIHGAYNESIHVFIDAGLKYCVKDNISILEIGFGTGLNALVSLNAIQGLNKKITYTGVEAYPVSEIEWSILEYDTIDNLSLHKHSFDKMHESDWEVPIQLDDNFTLIKQQKKFTDIEDIDAFDIIYFDAFAPSAQPDLWTVEIFSRMFDSLKSNGILVTYCAKGQVKRNMKEVGFLVEPLPGPPGKREMTRATKP